MAPRAMIPVGPRAMIPVGAIIPPSVIATAREAGGKQSITRNVVCLAPHRSSSAGLPRGVPPLAMTEKGWR